MTWNWCNIVSLFNKKPKLHVFEHVASLTRFHKGCAAVKCKNCEQQFALDMIGGWMVEWDFVIEDNGMFVDKNNFDAAVSHLRASYNTSRIKSHMYDICNHTEESTTKGESKNVDLKRKMVRGN